MDVQGKKPKKKPTKTEELTKEQIRQAILRKRECNSKALQIVECLLEKDVAENFFIKCLPDINQSHFEDVIEERSITHLCGYPLCSKQLAGDIPKQQYRISMRTNKVYDITARKSFCSNKCYKAATYVKKQMLTSPLWCREYEAIPKFQLLESDAVGSLGQEIDVSLVEKIQVKSNEAFASINDFASASLYEISGTEEESESKEPAQETDQKSQTTVEQTTAPDPTEQEPKSITEDPTIKTNNNSEPPHKKPQLKRNPMNIVGDIIEKPERKLDPVLTNTPATTTKKTINKTKKNQQKKQPPVTVITVEVEKCLAEWFTLDTLLLLFGEEKVKEMVSDKGECIKEYLNNYSKSIFYNSNTYDQYQTLCRKLNMLEIEDRRNKDLQRETKPLPDYSILQEESKGLQVKVRAFFSGETEIPMNVMEKTKVAEEVENLTQLPLVDKNAQNALRRRIVCEQLNKVLPDLLQSLGLSTLTISSDVRVIVNTFKLKADNIMFKPIQWTLIAIIIVKLLSLRDRRLEYLLGQPTAFKHLQLLLLSYRQVGGYLDRLILWLTDINRLLDTNDTQLTVEV